MHSVISLVGCDIIYLIVCTIALLKQPLRGKISYTAAAYNYTMARSVLAGF